MSDSDQYSVGQCAPGVWKPDREIPAAEQLARENLVKHINAGFRLIVATRNTWKVGKILTGTYGAIEEDGHVKVVYVHQPCCVRAVATFEEWIASTPPWIGGRKPMKSEARGFNFYEISSD